MSDSQSAGQSPFEPRDVDPYLAPQSGGGADDTSARGESGAPLDWEPFEALRFGFEAVKRHPISILAAFLASLVGSLVGGIGGVVQNLLSQNGDERLVTLGIVIYGVCMVLNIPLAAWMGLGQARYGLALARGERPDLSVLFQGDGLLSAIGLQAVYGFVGLLGGGVLFLPAILLFLRQWPDPGFEPLLASAAGLLVFVPVALLFAALGMLMLAITVVIAVWDGHRLLAAGLLTAMFLGISTIAVGFAWFTVSRGPRLLQATLEELRRDQDALEGVGTSEGDQRQRKPHDAPQR